MPFPSSLKTQLPPLLLASSSGVLLFLASPGSGGHGLLVWVALVPLLLAIHRVDRRRAALLGLLTGLLYHLPLLHWITVVLGEYGGVALPVAILALLLLALYMSLYPALFALLLLIGSKPTNDDAAPDWLKIIWLAPLLWVFLDWLRARLFTGFPWQDLAYNLYQYPLLIQAADLAGHYGITLVIVLVNALLAAALHTMFSRRPLYGYQQVIGPGQRSGKRPTTATLLLVLLPALLLPAALVGYGAFKLPRLEAAAATAPRLATTIVQGNIPQEDKWDYQWQEATVQRYLELSRRALAANEPELLIWPETALPFFPLEHPLLEPLIAFSNHHQVHLLAGAPHREHEPDGSPRYHNSALLLAPPLPGRPPESRPAQVADGRLSFYHKQHLVPFGEYIPLRRLLPYFAPIVETLGDFTPGPGPRLLPAGEHQLGVLICYEAIFPRLARRLTDHGAEVLINITNDAWFGATNAPWQHLSMAVLRAVENRRPLARAANTGISAFILPDGRIQQATGLFTADWRHAQLPLPTKPARRTLFATGGHLLPLFCLLLLSAGGLTRFYVNMRRSSK